MAVITIAKIQVRRGKKHEGTGVPQLSSGELGWALDTRELFIGNGAVSEGAPEIGNTRILTEYDNIFDLPQNYSYKANSVIRTGSTANAPTARSLQDRLDEWVSVESFGAVGDGVTDCTVSIQRAINELYITNSSIQNRIELRFLPGEYLISDELLIPPHTVLVGSGSNNTFIRQTTPGRAVIRTVDDTGSALMHDDSYVTQCNNVRISSMTMTGVANISVAVLQNCRDSEFDQVCFTGSWDYTQPIRNDEAGVILYSLSELVGSNNNTFNRCVFERCSYGVQSDQSIKHNTWNQCVFQDTAHGVVFGEFVDSGEPGVPVLNHIENSRFERINQHGIWVKTGYNNTSKNNTFENVGNDLGSDLSPYVPVIRFDRYSNLSMNDQFSRTRALIVDNSTVDFVDYVPEIEGSGFFELDYTDTVTVPYPDKLDGFLRLPYTGIQSYRIEYQMDSLIYGWSKTGVLVVKPDLSQTPAVVGVVDDSEYVGDALYAYNVHFHSQFDAVLNIIHVGVTVESDSTISDQARLNFQVSFANRHASW